MTDPDRGPAAESASEVVAPPAGIDKGDSAPNDTGDAAPVKGEAPAPAKKGTDWWAEIKAIFWLILAVLAFHSLIAKPFYIPSESMMPGLLVGDRLVVTKYPYGWSWVSPSFHILPHMEGRLWGALPERGDVVIVTPPGGTSDYIKRVIGLPGDTVAVIDGVVQLNGRPLPRVARPPVLIPVDANTPCGHPPARDPDPYGDFRVTGPDGRFYCRLPIYRETLPNGRTYDTIDVGQSPGDDYPPHLIPPGHVFLMGDNRDHSADSRFPIEAQGLGGPVPWENLGGRAEFITFSLDGSSSYWNPISWFTALRSGRAGTSLHAERVTAPQAGAPPPPPEAPAR